LETIKRLRKSWQEIKCERVRSKDIENFMATGPFKVEMMTAEREDRLTLRVLMSYIYGAPILDVSRSHTTTQHSR